MLLQLHCTAEFRGNRFKDGGESWFNIGWEKNLTNNLC